MNYSKGFKYLAIGVVSTIFVGCSSSSQGLINTFAHKKVQSVGKNSNSIQINLPVRYSVEEFKEIALVTQFTGDKDTADVIDLLETDMMKIKKFTQYSRHMGDIANLRDEMHRIDSGADIKESKVAKKADYILAVKIDKTKTEQKLNDNKSLILFTTELKYQINSQKDNRNISSGVIKGQAKRYKYYEASWNKRLRKNFYKQVKGHGFNGTEYKADTDAFRQASRRASKIMQYRIGNAFPAGGAVMSWREANGSHQIQLDSGLNQGIMKNQYFVIYTNDSGIDTPIALAKVKSLASDSTVLSLERWNNKDPFSKKIIDDLKLSSYKNATKKDFYAVAISMPDPRFKD
jgi:hypothetical protein